MNYATFFHQTDSEQMVEPDATFFKPNMFDDRLSEVSRRIEELNLRQRGATPMGGTPGMGGAA